MRRRVLFIHPRVWTHVSTPHGWSQAMAEGLAVHHDVEILCTPNVVVPPDWDGPDFVLCTYAGDAVLAADIARAAGGVPYALWINGGVPAEWTRTPEGAAAFSGAHLIFCSGSAQGEFFQSSAVLPRAGIVIAHGADDRYTELLGPVASQHSEYPHRRGFVAFGANNARKRPAFVSRALREEELTFLAVDLAGASTIFKAEHDRHRIAWHSPLYDANDEARKFAALAASRGLVCASEHEGFYIPAAEAALVGTPLLSVPLPVILELWGDAALYFESKDELRRLAARMRDNNDLVEECGQRMHSRAVERGYTLTAMSERIARFVDDVCA